MANAPGYREKCFAAHGRRCTECDTGFDVVAHHINGNRDDNRRTNLTPLCRSCHLKIHAGNRDMNAWLVGMLPPESRTDLPDKAPEDTEDRPDIVPRYIHGSVEDYAEEHGINLTTAYAKVVDEGLHALSVKED